ncbi:outer membrane channel protein TolC [Colwellia sp. 4_MG-2023]|jgi:outer membrane protein|uniref:outer membrane channel protein TolC n=1 Tax=unclassified Colwellia TaxID=196834 RepID=UPI001C0810FC|nr:MULTISPECIES: outer membrane channel protein TolC [unclassified Colwellia]MBU2925209.1 outer membrane channel protein TolC [Colwellia sp. C2M11]MDO6506777.1 outer membrane channel protein TolC [Colwellia sp. 5_MG-2023]MDO6555603.1 outer membrane channel protein TolC [Colwellia sp. 4_MG-2023]MDO6651266.1 outer membrane channel protein TolC [Colwellia sp. 3_MG-2023]MDO6664311.1 outer membrane channel protein TolC [Colwellia sp. 2_MG-2023]
MKKTLSTIIIALVGSITATNTQAEDLLSVYQQALLNDTVVLKARAQFEIVKEDITLARSALLPQISAYANYSDGESESYDYDLNDVYTTEFKSLGYGANLNMQLYHHDSWLRLNIAEKSAHQSDLVYQVAKQDLIVRVAQAYFSLLSTKDDLVFAQAEKAAIARQLEQTKQRFSVGLTAITDVHEAQAQYDTAVTEEIRAKNAIFSAEEELRVITNNYPKSINVLNTDRFSTSTPTPNSADEWQKAAEAKNLDLIASRVGIEIAKQTISSAKAGHYPTLDFDASYNSNDSDSNINSINVNTPALNDYSVGVTLNVPIYSGGAIESSVRTAQNNFVLASQDLMQTHRSVVRTTRNAYNTVVASISSIKAFEQSVLSATKALEATEAGFEVGTRTIVDVLDSTRNLYNAKRNLSSTRYAYIQNVLLLKRAGGTITDEDITAINTGLMAAK